MIRDLSNKEKEINDFMKACREWLVAGKPQSSIFKEDMAICESLDYFLGWRGTPAISTAWYSMSWEEVNGVRGVLKKQFMRLGLDKVYPFNRKIPSMTGGGWKEPDDHYFSEIHNGTIWDNEDRVAFVMNFKPLEETNDEQ